MPVSNRLDSYAEGDPEFKRELATLLVREIQELQQSLLDAVNKKDVDIYSFACHKMKAPINMLGDAEFSNLIDDIGNLMKSKPSSNGEVAEKIKSFMICPRRLFRVLKKK